jgi:transposase
VPTAPADLPDDIAALRRLVLEQSAALQAQKLEIEMLKVQLARLRRERFGRSSEKLDRTIEQLELTLGELEEALGKRGSRPSCRRATGPRHLSVGPCPRICRARRSSTRRPARARIAAARYTAWART